MADDAREAAGAAAERAAIDRRLERIKAMPAGEARVAATRELADWLAEIYAEVTAYRAAEMLRIRDEEALSLAKLADRVGVSKARAVQFIQADERRKQKERDARGHEGQG